MNDMSTFLHILPQSVQSFFSAVCATDTSGLQNYNDFHIHTNIQNIIKSSDQVGKTVDLSQALHQSTEYIIGEGLLPTWAYYRSRPIENQHEKILMLKSYANIMIPIFCVIGGMRKSRKKINHEMNPAMMHSFCLILCDLIPSDIDFESVSGDFYSLFLLGERGVTQKYFRKALVDYEKTPRLI